MGAHQHPAAGIGGAATNSTTAVLQIQVPALSLTFQVRLNLKPLTAGQIFESLEELVTDFSSDLGDEDAPVDLEGSEEKLADMCQQVLRSMEEYRSNLKLMDQWRTKADRATAQLSDMREAYLKEVNALREQLFMKSRAEKEGLNFQPSATVHFYPGKWGADDGCDKVEQVREQVKEDYERQLREVEALHRERVARLTEQLQASKMLMARKDVLLERCTARASLNQEQDKLNEDLVLEEGADCAGEDTRTTTASGDGGCGGSARSASTQEASEAGVARAEPPTCDAATTATGQPVWCTEEAPARASVDVLSTRTCDSLPKPTPMPKAPSRQHHPGRKSQRLVSTVSTTGVDARRRASITSVDRGVGTGPYEPSFLQVRLVSTGTQTPGGLSEEMQQRYAEMAEADWRALLNPSEDEEVSASKASLPPATATESGIDATAEQLRLSHAASGAKGREPLRPLGAPPATRPARRSTIGQARRRSRDFTSDEPGSPSSGDQLPHPPGRRSLPTGTVEARGEDEPPSPGSGELLPPRRSLALGRRSLPGGPAEAALELDRLSHDPHSGRPGCLTDLLQKHGINAASTPVPQPVAELGGGMMSRVHSERAHKSTVRMRGCATERAATERAATERAATERAATSLMEHKPAHDDEDDEGGDMRALVSERAKTIAPGSQRFVRPTVTGRPSLGLGRDGRGLFGLAAPQREAAEPEDGAAAERGTSDSSAMPRSPTATLRRKSTTDFRNVRAGAEEGRPTCESPQQADVPSPRSTTPGLPGGGLARATRAAVAELLPSLTLRPASSLAQARHATMEALLPMAAVDGAAAPKTARGAEALPSPRAAKGRLTVMRAGGK